MEGDRVEGGKVEGDRVGRWRVIGWRDGSRGWRIGGKEK